MTRLAIVDAGPLYAAADTSDRFHAESVAALSAPRWRLVVAPFAIAEATYMVGQRLGAAAEARFLAGLAGFDVEPLLPEDLARMAELVGRYADFPLGGSDAAVIAIAERLGAETIITLDRRHFSVVRPRHCEAFSLQP